MTSVGPGTTPVGRDLGSFSPGLAWGTSYHPLQNGGLSYRSHWSYGTYGTDETDGTHKTTMDALLGLIASLSSGHHENLDVALAP